VRHCKIKFSSRCLSKLGVALHKTPDTPCSHTFVPPMLQHSQCIPFPHVFRCATPRDWWGTSRALKLGVALSPLSPIKLAPGGGSENLQRDTREGWAGQNTVRSTSERETRIRPRKAWREGGKFDSETDAENEGRYQDWGRAGRRAQLSGPVSPQWSWSTDESGTEIPEGPTKSSILSHSWLYCIQRGRSRG